MTKDNEKEPYFLTHLKRDVKEMSNGKYSQETVEAILRLAFDKISDVLAIEGRPVYLIDFLNFTPKDFAAKESKNPQSGKAMTIDPYRVVYSKPSKKFKAKLDQAFK